MNVYDSTRMMDALASTGYEPTASVDEADMIILNTCHIREKAAEKVYSELGRLRQVQESRVRTDGSRVLSKMHVQTVLFRPFLRNSP